MINNSCTVGGLNTTKPCQCAPALPVESFPTISTAWQGMLQFRRCECGKQNKQTTFLCLIDKLLCEMDWRNPWILEAKDNAHKSERSAWLTISGCNATISAAAQNTSSMLHWLLDPFSISFCIYIFTVSDYWLTQNLRKARVLVAHMHWI